jgi:serine/threonine-protein kinase
MKAWMPTRRFAGIAVAAVGVWLGSAGAASAATNNIFTVAGTGVAGFSGDHGPATAAKINGDYGVAPTPDGGFVIADATDDLVRRVGPDGIITTIAGTGIAGYSGDGGLATTAKLNAPLHVVAKPDGSVLIADTLNNRVRLISPFGTITTIAGTGTAGYSGDGGQATSAQLDSPVGLALAADGSVVIADNDNDVVRRVAPDGVISTIAGTGTAGYSGDGGPGTGAQLRDPYGLAVAADGAVLIADTGNDRVRRLAPDGIITTVAGNGVDGNGGDGGPATAAELDTARGIAAAPDGSLLIADSSGDRVRRVAPDGIISTIAGTGVGGYSGDGVPAVAAKLNAPTDVAVTAGGGLLIADNWNHRVRWVDTALLAPAVGPAPQPGDAGPAVAPPNAKLAVALGFGRLSARRGRPVTIRYAATAAADVTIRMRRNGHTVKKLVRHAHDGRNTVRFRMPRRAGRYTLEIKAVGSDGQVATDSARVTLARR